MPYVRRLASASFFAVCLLAAASAVQAADTNEPNDSPNTAVPIASGSPVESYIASSTDVDFYTFFVPASRHVRIDLALPAHLSYSLTLYDSAGGWLAFGAGYAEGVPRRIDYSLTAGTYYIRVSGSSAEFDAASAYTLILTSPLTGDRLEPNDTRGNAVPIMVGTTVESYVFTSNDSDWYRIDTTSDGHIRAVLNIPSTTDYDLAIYDASGFVMEGSSNFGTGLDEEVLTTGPAGRYFIQVSSWRDHYAQGVPYRLTVDAGTFGDTFEPNNTQATARPIAAGILRSKVYTEDDQDWYRFDVTAAGQLEALLDVPPSANLTLTLFDAAGWTLRSGTGGYGSGVDQSISHGLTATGTYYLRVTGYLPSIHESYGLAVTAPVASPRPQTPGDFTGDGAADFALYHAATGAWRVRHQPALTFGGTGVVPVAADYNGDRAADLATYHRATGEWRVAEQFTAQFGDRGDIPVPGDYDGDGDADLAVYRPSTGVWYVRGQFAVQYGGRGFIPVPADYDGDGDTDIAVFERATGWWYVRNQVMAQLGTRGDLAVPADYDGDGTVDLAVYRPSTGEWLVRGREIVRLGNPGDIPVPRDYDGDGSTDLAVFRPANRTWIVNGQSPVQFGEPGDLPVPRGFWQALAADGDYTGDGATDLALYRPATGAWFVRNGPLVQFGDDDDRPVAADYDGDGVTDVAVFRPATGQWFVRNKFSVQFGGATDVPVPGDYDGDGRVDVAIYRPSNGYWYVRGQMYVQFGDSGDIPVPADYDGDGVTDIAVYRPSTGVWFVRGQMSVQFGGLEADVPLPADYDGDGRADLAIYRASTGTWYARGLFAVQFGDPGDEAVPGDYNGDGITDIAVYRPSTGHWFVRGQLQAQFGDAGDVPVVRAIRRQ